MKILLQFLSPDIRLVMQTDKVANNIESDARSVHQRDPALCAS